MTVVNTTELTRDIKGFKGITPVKIFIKKNKVVKVEALPNRETLKFFEKVKPLLKHWMVRPLRKLSIANPMLSLAQLIHQTLL